ncbi:MAG TPA: tetratricopeptide repeat protein [Vicinamibacteria bacterium]|jgi:tetratricopeptide (TPR) repeat protein
MRHAARRHGWAALACLAAASSSWAAASRGPAELVEERLAAAEASLQAGESQLAESHYRSAVGEGLLVLGSLEAAEGRLDKARDAFQGALAAMADGRQPTQHLAMALLELGEAKEAVTLMTHLATRNARDMGIRRLLAQALILAGRPGEALQELEAARTVAPDDLETLYVLASGNLRMKKLAAAEELFAELARQRPIAATHVLIGRTWRDYNEHARARAELKKALALDPRARRAHYYLGMVAAIEDLASLDPAIAEFQEELKLAPDDLPTNLSLGLAFVMARRYEEAIPPLSKAVRWQPPQASAFHFLGRALVALERPAEAKAALERALELAKKTGREDSQLRNIEYQLGLALRQLGQAEPAAAHFAEAERLTEKVAAGDRESLDLYLRDAAGPLPVGVPILDTSAFASLTAEERAALGGRVRTAVARASFNLGVMQAQAGRFGQAAFEFEKAALVEPDFPQLAYSLGVSWFNAQQPRKARQPLERALAATPGDQNLRRMLALASLEADEPARAVELLAGDAGRDADASLQYAYALALVRSGRVSEAEPVFKRLIAQHGDTAELHVLVGQAHAQQGDYPGAIQSFERALALKPAVADANAALGLIYLEQGKLEEAERALRRELAARPGDSGAQHTLAAVLELSGKLDESLAMLRQVLKARPDFGSARYLFGKVLLAQGKAELAAEQLEAAARIAPGDANVHYQLGRAYQALGRAEAAQRQFDVFQKLKDERRGPTS